MAQYELFSDKPIVDGCLPCSAGLVRRDPGGDGLLAAGFVHHRNPRLQGTPQLYLLSARCPYPKK